jgi:hypothetical protein
MRVALEKDPEVSAEGVASSTAGESTTQRRDPFLEEVLAEERPDRFDPAVFNRRVHGRE